MLKAHYGELQKGKDGKIKVNSTKLAPHPLDELYRLIDRLVAARPRSSYGRGVSGDHAWIILSDHGFNWSVNFGEGCREDGVISFLLYGPYSPDDAGDIYDGRGLHGHMTTACLKGLLAVLDQGRSPLAYVRKSALDAHIVTD